MPPQTPTTGASPGKAGAVEKEKQQDTLIYMPTNNCARIMLLLKLLGVDKEIKIKSPKELGGLKSEDYLKINPQGKFPATPGRKSCVGPRLAS